MTLRQWLARERQPHFSGINARQTLRNMVGTSGLEIHKTVNLNAFFFASRRFDTALDRFFAAQAK